MVHSGRVATRIAGTLGDIGTGDTVNVPGSVAHAWWNPHDEPAEVLVELTPARDTGTLVETMFGLAVDGKVNPRSSMPRGLQLMILGHAFRREIALPPPTGRAALFLADLAASVARMRGYRPRYERYSGPDRPA